MTANPPACGALKADGESCLNPNVQYFASVKAYRCPFHKPPTDAWTPARDAAGKRIPPPPIDDPDPMPNDGVMRTLEDALAMIRWVTREAARGTIGETRTRAVVSGAQAFISALHKSSEAAELRALNERLDKLGAPK